MKKTLLSVSGNARAVTSLFSVSVSSHKLLFISSGSLKSVYFSEQLREHT